MISFSILLPLALISLLAGMAKGVTGFGAAMVMAPLFGLLLPAPEAGALIVLVHCATCVQGVRRWGRLVQWKSVVPLALVALICTAVAMRWIASSGNPQLHRVIGFAVLAITVLHLRGWRWRHGGGIRPTITAGVLSGAMTAIGGMGGPPAVYYFSGMSLTAEKGNKGESGIRTDTVVLRANLLGYFAVLFVGATILLAANRQLHAPLLISTCLLVPAFVGGVVLGERLYGWLPAVWFNRIVVGLLLVSGGVALV
ncbi:sulfite exporter TauE/SafE family protein [Herbaspirillum rhizosphaerae]|uniref:Probable membrane transporter protein n=1 Tax=Herbaspirillum rhizosphaerae TaxID=346179 RepID=A0ABW8Z1C4_9BURK